MGTEPIFANLADPKEVPLALAALQGPLHGFINAAGILPAKNFTESTAESLTELFNINVISPMLILKAAVPLLVPGGVVVLFGSISGHKGSYDDGYAASKGAIHSLVRSLVDKLSPQHRIIGIAPGMVENTRMTDELVPGRFEENLKKIPLRKAGRPEDIAALTLFVLSDACQFMTGSILDINGGQYLRS
jgi:3-oxoacyl-[acyl-carrier protein] reductase